MNKDTKFTDIRQSCKIFIRKKIRNYNQNKNLKNNEIQYILLAYLK